MMKRRQLLKTGLAFGTGYTWSLMTLAQSWPQKPVRVIVPFSGGSFTETAARAIGQELSNNLGQPFVIETRGGAGSTLGTDLVAKSAPDGYTLLINTSGQAVAPALYKKLTYDAVKDLAPIAGTVASALILVVPLESSARTVKDFIALAKTRPGEINYASAGTSSVGDLATELFNRRAGIRTNAVPYKGNAPAMIDTVGGQVQLFFGAIGPMFQILNFELQGDWHTQYNWGFMFVTRAGLVQRDDLRRARFGERGLRVEHVELRAGAGVVTGIG